MIRPRRDARSAAVITAGALLPASDPPVRRKLDKLDLVAVLKSRD